MLKSLMMALEGIEALSAAALQLVGVGVLE
jgi:hypothetical protein